MDRIKGAGHVGHMFVAEDAATSRPPTEITAEWLNGVQEMLALFAEWSGQALSDSVHTQLIDGLVARFEPKGATSIPAGMYGEFGTPTAPDGWLVCDGSAVSRVIYARLFTAIGVTHGAGDGATTFNLPDARGRVLRGWDNGAGRDPGRSLGSTQDDAIQNIVGTIGMTKGVEGATATGAFEADFVDVDFAQHAGGTVASHGTFSFDASRAVRTASETRVKNLAVLVCIKT